MIHLLTARRLRPDGGTLFYVGSIAPDAVSGWHEKDSTHFRDRDDREQPLLDLAKETDGDFAEGVLLHLYTDWKWDIAFRDAYIDRHGPGWFPDYRAQLGQAGRYIYRTSDWALPLWKRMEQADPALFGDTPAATPDQVHSFLISNHCWHRQFEEEGPSPAFPPDQIDAFVEQIAAEYPPWREAAGRT